MNRGGKVRVVERIMKNIKDQGGRFLELAPETGRWVELPNESMQERKYPHTFETVQKII